MIERIDQTLSRLDTIKGHYESPPEEMLGERICAAVASGVTYSTQTTVCTDAGTFRMDMLLASEKGRRVAIEVDGREFHDPKRDHWRTVFILCTGQVDVIYRVRAIAVYSNLVGVLAGLAAIEPEMFRSEEAARWRVATERQWPADRIDDDSFADGEYDNGDRIDDRDRCGYGARSGGARPENFWGDANTCMPHPLKPYVNFIRESGLLDIDQLKDAWEARRRQNEPPRPKIFDDLFDDD
jgi:hypothetical protein